MKLKNFFYNSDLLCTKADTVTDGNQLFLFYMLKNGLPTTYTVKSDDGLSTKTISINFFGDSLLGAQKWKMWEREYLFNHSGDKETSVLLDEIYSDSRFVSSTDYTWYKTYISLLAGDILAKYADSWCRLWYAVNEKYNPLWNVDGITKDVPSDDYKLTHETSGWNVDKVDKVDSANKTYGFNSSSAVPTEESSETPANTISVTESGVPSNQHEIQQNKQTSNDTQEGYLQNVRGGNIGVTMSQQLLNAEFEYRLTNNFYDVVFKNIDDVLTASCYGRD